MAYFITDNEYSSVKRIYVDNFDQNSVSGQKYFTNYSSCADRKGKQS